jgi:PAS domain-containing protein
MGRSSGISGSGSSKMQTMLNRVIYGDDILAQAKSLAIKALYIKWKTLSQLKRLSLTDFLESDERIAGRILVQLFTGDDYVCIYHGAEHRKALGHDLSGRPMSEAASRVTRGMREIYDQVREMGIPMRIVFASEGANVAVGWERIVLPVRVAGDVRILVTYSEALNSAGDVHRFLFENSPHMLIVALPISTHDDELVDADMIEANPTASRFFGLERFTEWPIRLRQLSPWFNDDETWRLLTAKTDVIEREHFLAGPTGQDFKCAIVKLDYLLVIRLYLIDVPELVAIG